MSRVSFTVSVRVQVPEGETVGQARERIADTLRKAGYQMADDDNTPPRKPRTTPHVRS